MKEIEIKNVIFKDDPKPMPVINAKKFAPMMPGF
jgi:hypothetical protein